MLYFSGGRPPFQTVQAPSLAVTVLKEALGALLLTDSTQPILRFQALTTILENFRSLYRDETARHHAVEYRQESVDLIL